MVEAVRAGAFRFRYLLAAIVTFCYAIQYLDRVKTNVLIPFISKDIGMTNYEIGIGAALMLIFYGPSQVVTGWFCDKIGMRKVMIFSIIAWSFLTYWQGEVRSVTEWYFRMVLFGIMIGTEFVPSTKLIVRYFPPLQRARAQSVLSWAWIITPAWAPMLSTLLYTYFGNNWREVFHVLAFAGVIPLILILLFVYDHPERNRFVSKDEAVEVYEEEIAQGLITEDDVRSGNVDAIATKSKSIDVPFGRILRTPGYMPLVFVYVAAQLAYWGVMAWSAQYLVQVHGFNVMQMGVWASVYFIGGALGSFVSGWVSDRVLGGRRKPMIILCFVCMIPFIVILASLTKGVSPFVLLLTLTGAGFFSNMVWGPAITLPADMFPVESYGKAMGGVNCIAYIVAAASPYIMGVLIKVDPVAKTADYFNAWIWVACTAVIGIVAASLLVDKKSKAGKAGLSA
ncbi:MAG: MFS transporter [Negativicutes bacterium]|nr:MFS transporter [Negativicutes bacterium]